MDQYSAQGCGGGVGVSFSIGGSMTNRFIECDCAPFALPSPDRWSVPTGQRSNADIVDVCPETESFRTLGLHRYSPLGPWLGGAFGGVRTSRCTDWGAPSELTGPGQHFQRSQDPASATQARGPGMVPSAAIAGEGTREAGFASSAGDRPGGCERRGQRDSCGLGKRLPCGRRPVSNFHGRRDGEGGLMRLLPVGCRVGAGGCLVGGWSLGGRGGCAVGVEVEGAKPSAPPNHPQSRMDCYMERVQTTGSGGRASLTSAGHPGVDPSKPSVSSLVAVPRPPAPTQLIGRDSLVSCRQLETRLGMEGGKGGIPSCARGSQTSDVSPGNPVACSPGVGLLVWS